MKKLKLVNNEDVAQEYECDWSIMEMQIYLMNEENHLKDLSTINKNNLHFFAGLDVGYRDENAFVVIGTDGDNYYIVDEYIQGEVPTSVLAEEMNSRIEKWDIENIYIDSSAQQLKADLAYEYDIYCENAIKSVNDGISAVQVLVEKVRLLCDINNTMNTFNALTNYKWNEKTEIPKPIHDWASHPSDAVRYAIYTHLRNNVDITF